MGSRVIEHVVAVGVKAGEQTGARRRAESQGRIGPFEKAGIPGQVGDVRRSDQRLLITGQQIDPQLVTEKNQDVWFTLGWP